MRVLLALLLLTLPGTLPSPPGSADSPSDVFVAAVQARILAEPVPCETLISTVAKEGTRCARSLLELGAVMSAAQQVAFEFSERGHGKVLALPGGMGTWLALDLPEGATRHDWVIDQDHVVAVAGATGDTIEIVFVVRRLPWPVPDNWPAANR